MDPGDDTALHLAADGGHEAVVRVLLENGADLALKNYFGIPVLHSAAHNGQKAVVQLLLENGADIEAKNESGATALHWAADGDHDTVVLLLLEKGANVEAKDNRGETALHGAAKYGHNNVVRLLEAKTNGGETALQQAAGNGHEVVVRQLLEHNGDDASYKKWIAIAQLYQASMDSDVAVMQQLIDDGADIKAKDIGGETALDRAGHFKYEAVMQVLLQSKVDASGEE
jgi:ankyrin repeat protein